MTLHQRERVRSFFMKDDFDYENANINLYDFHPQLRIFLVAKGIFFNNTNSKLRYIWPCFCMAASIAAISIESIGMFHAATIKDYSYATESFAYVMILFVIPILYTSTLLNVTHIKQLIIEISNDFAYVCSLGPKYKKPFLAGQLLVWKSCVVWLGFSSVIAVLYISSTFLLLLFQSLFKEQDETTVRPLIFPLWLPEDDPYRTPNYEVFLAWQIVFVLIILQTYNVYIYVLFHLLLHNYFMMDMIILDFGVLFEDLDEEAAKLPRHHPRRLHVQRVLNSRIRRIVMWHNDVIHALERISSVYGPPIVYQLMFVAIIICLMAYEIVDSLERGQVHYMLVLLCIATVISLWIPCYLGTLIRNKGYDVGEACWSCGWNESPLGALVRADIILIIQRTQRPLTIKYTGVPNLELETFSAAMRASYSYFNLLRQY